MEQLIYDRTIDDIKNLTKKGYYNLSDLNRVNSYIKYLSDGYGLNLTIHNFVLGEAVTRQKIQQILDNLKTLKENCLISPNAPTVPEALPFNYNKANDIEKILNSLYNFFVSSKLKQRSATFRAGQQIIMRS